MSIGHRLAGVHVPVSELNVADECRPGATFYTGVVQRIWSTRSLAEGACAANY